MERWLFGIFIFLIQVTHAVTEFVIVTPSYNNEAWCIANVESVVKQAYPHWHMIIINDVSTDRTSELLHSYIESHNLHDKIKLIDNNERKGALRNLYETIHQCPADVVIVTLDGDDEFAGPHVLQRIAQEYADPKVWLTYGQYKAHPGGALGMCRPFPSDVLLRRSFRSYQWLSSHPRTFKAWLFQRIKKEDLIYEGKFFPVTWDLAMMFPMLEMASKGHIRCIQDVLYIYNIQNPLNDFRHSGNLQMMLDQYIRKKKRYAAL